MKWLLALFILTAGAALAQNPSPIQSVTVAPSGACGNTQVKLLTPDGVIYTCQHGVWGVASGGGGGATKTCTLTAQTSCTIANPPTNAVYGFTDNSGNWSAVEMSSVTGANTALATITFDSNVTGTVAARGGSGGGGSGTVTSAVLAGTAGQITATGTCTITTTGTCTSLYPRTSFSPVRSTALR